MENNEYQNPTGSDNEATCPVLGCIAQKQAGGNR
jgi:hypothetical protein